MSAVVFLTSAPPIEFADSFPDFDAEDASSRSFWESVPAVRPHAPTVASNVTVEAESMAKLAIL
ncbi:hypothetical protein EBU99_01365 [bacterium]|nr:hypothetical protein [bacterium]